MKGRVAPESAAKPREHWFVYVARCTDGSLYTGIAIDVAARIAAHDSGRGARYTRGRGPLVLCGSTRCASKGDALRVEYAIKSLSRVEKLVLSEAPARLRKFAREVLRAG